MRAGPAVVAAGLAFALGGSVPIVAARAAAPSLAELDARARAAGNRKDEAVRIGRVLFATVWPVQLTRIRVESVGRHSIAGLVLSAVKFHQRVDRAGFLNEVELLVGRAFAASSVEEVDVWATVPLPYHAHETVSGDAALPTARTVFALTCRRDRLAGLAARLRSGDGIYWSDDFRAKLKPSGG
jgi:hypothetical protein